MAHKDSVNFVLVGVGGQGIILASDLLAEVGLDADYDVKQAEVHGMAQRGGSVSSHVRWGEHVYSPLIAAGMADILVAFESVEAVRFAHFLRPGGLALVNQQAIVPVTVSAGPATYPPLAYLSGELDRITPHVHWVPALDVAQDLGHRKVVNVVMLGALSTLLPVPTAVWLTTIKSLVPRRHLEVNQQAFARGRQLQLDDSLTAVSREIDPVGVRP